MSRRSQKRLSRRKAELRDAREPWFERRGRRAAHKDELSDQLVSSLSAKSREYAVHDIDQPGLFLRVRQSGSMSYYYRPHGRSNKKAVSLGSTAQLNVADARFKALQLEARLMQGASIREMSSRASAATVSRAFEAYSPRCSQEWMARILREFSAVVLPAIGETKLADLTRQQLESVISERATYYGRRNLRGVISAFLSWCVETGRIEANVLKGGRTIPRPQARKRMELGGAALGTVWNACETLPRRWRDAFRLVIASGQPISKVLNLPANALHTWGDDAYLFGPLATEVLRGIEPSGTPWLFSAPGKNTPMRFQQGMLNRLRDALGWGPLTASDLHRASIELGATRSGLGLRWDDLFPPPRANLHPDDEVVL